MFTSGEVTPPGITRLDAAEADGPGGNPSRPSPYSCRKDGATSPQKPAAGCLDLHFKVGRVTPPPAGQDKTIKHAKVEQTAAGGDGSSHPPTLAQRIRHGAGGRRSALRHGVTGSLARPGWRRRQR